MAMLNAEEQAFIDDLKTVCEKHKMFLAPTYEQPEDWLVNYHDPMRITVFDEQAQDVLNRAIPFDINRY